MSHTPDWDKVGPELLAALKFFKWYWWSGLAGSTSKKAQAARAQMHAMIDVAIAKAEGRDA